MQHHASALIGMRAETFIHAGAGSTMGVIDLPIQRESHTGWPCIYGSSVKGAFRSAAGSRARDSVETLFGPDTQNADKHSGALAFMDARLLLLPVRSLTSHYLLVTSPAVLKRYSRDRERFGLTSKNIHIPEPDSHSALSLSYEGDLFLEDVKLSTRKGQLRDVVSYIAEVHPSSEAEKTLGRQLLVVDDDMFKYFADHATPATPHVKLGKNKTAASGALWYEESLAPETLLYTAVVTEGARDGSELDAGAAIHSLKEIFSDFSFIQIGGGETVGMGWFELSMVTEGSGK